MVNSLKQFAKHIIKRQSTNDTKKNNINFEIAKKDGVIRTKADWNAVVQIAKVIGKSRTETVQEYSGRVTELNISFEEFNRFEMYNMPLSLQETTARTLNRKRRNNEKKIDVIAENMGVSPAEVKGLVKQCKERTGYNIDVPLFYELELDLKDDQEIDYIVDKIQKATDLSKKLKIFLEDVRFGDLEFNEVRGLLDEMYDLCEVYATERKAEVFQRRYPESILKEIDHEELARITQDSVVTEMILGFSPKEYVAFGFKDKDFEKRLEYLPDKDKRKMLAHMITTEAREILNNKYKSYQVFNEW